MRFFKSLLDLGLSSSRPLPLCARVRSVAAAGGRVMSEAASSFSYNTVQPYSPPEWAQPIRYKPTSFVKLALRPTPIHQWHLPGLPDGFQVWVKRDDMTGSTLGGNKIRKLEFLLADALERGCDCVVTCGSIQSNHARATAVAARQLGMQPHLLLRWKGDMPQDTDAVGCTGNLLLDRAVGAKIVLTPHVGYETKTSYEKSMKGLKEMMQEYAEKLRSAGSNPYVIPVGGSNAVGTWGYIEAFQELLEEGVPSKFDDIVVATGSGGTICGLAVANYLSGSRIRLHAICVCDNADFFYHRIDQELQGYGLTTDKDGKPLNARDLVNIVDGYKGKGYAMNTEEELAQLLEIVTKTAVPLDPVYTLKGVRGMLGELRNNPTAFAGNRILYIHTGGVFGLYDGTVDPLLKQLPSSNQVSRYSDTT